MTTVLIIMMILVMCGLLVLVILDLVRRGKSNGESQTQTAPAAEPVAAAAATADVQEEEEPQNEPEQSNSEESVSFAVTGQSATLEEKYLDLTPQYKSYYDQIVQHAMRKTGAKRIKNSSYEEYKFYHARLVRLQIKSGVVNCQFLLMNSDFQSYISDNKVKIKQAPITIRVVDDESLQVAKNSVDIAYDAAVNERERKMQIRRDKVKQAREAKKAAAKEANQEE